MENVILESSVTFQADKMISTGLYNIVKLLAIVQYNIMMLLDNIMSNLLFFISARKNDVLFIRKKRCFVRVLWNIAKHVGDTMSISVSCWKFFSRYDNMTFALWILI